MLSSAFLIYIIILLKSSLSLKIRCGSDHFSNSIKQNGFYRIASMKKASLLTIPSYTASDESIDFGVATYFPSQLNRPGFLANIKSAIMNFLHRFIAYSMRLWQRYRSRLLKAAMTELPPGSIYLMNEECSRLPLKTVLTPSKTREISPTVVVVPSREREYKRTTTIAKQYSNPSKIDNFRNLNVAQALSSRETEHNSVAEEVAITSAFTSISRKSYWPNSTYNSRLRSARSTLETDSTNTLTSASTSIDAPLTLESSRYRSLSLKSANTHSLSKPLPSPAERYLSATSALDSIMNELSIKAAPSESAMRNSLSASIETFSTCSDEPINMLCEDTSTMITDSPPLTHRYKSAFSRICTSILTEAIAEALNSQAAEVEFNTDISADVEQTKTAFHHSTFSVDNDENVMIEEKKDNQSSLFANGFFAGSWELTHKVITGSDEILSDTETMFVESNGDISSTMEDQRRFHWNIIDKDKVSFWSTTNRCTQVLYEGHLLGSRIIGSMLMQSTTSTDKCKVGEFQMSKLLM